MSVKSTFAASREQQHLCSRVCPADAPVRRVCVRARARTHACSCKCASTSLQCVYAVAYRMAVQSPSHARPKLDIGGGTGFACQLYIDRFAQATARYSGFTHFLMQHFRVRWCHSCLRNSSITL